MERRGLELRVVDVGRTEVNFFEDYSYFIQTNIKSEILGSTGIWNFLEIIRNERHFFFFLNWGNLLAPLQPTYNFKNKPAGEGQNFSKFFYKISNFFIL